MAKRIEVKNYEEAWAIADQIFPSDYEEDSRASENAGYKIYRSRIEFYDYICDLGDRLEINLKNGKTVNVWIVKDEPKEDNVMNRLQIMDALMALSDRLLNEAKECFENQKYYMENDVKIMDEKSFAEGCAYCDSSRRISVLLAAIRGEDANV